MNSRCMGLTLVELMIAMVLSLLLMGGVVSIFIGTKETFKLEEDLSRVQENFRYISDRLTKDLSLVGYMGCSLTYDQNDIARVYNRINGNSWDVIVGTEGVSDSLTLSYAKPETAVKVIAGKGADVTSPISISTGSSLYAALRSNLAEIEAERMPIKLLVGNCNDGDIFVVTGINEHDADVTGSPPAGEAELKHEKSVIVGGISNYEESFKVPYGDQSLSAASVFLKEEVTYEICSDEITRVTGLCVTRGGGDTEMLMPDVTDFQVKYGLDSNVDGNADHYIDWSNSLNIPDITSIRVSLSMVLSKAGSNDVTKTYSFTVKLRNMGLNI